MLKIKPLMNWILLQSPDQLAAIQSAKGDSIIFKHSTRCSISMITKRRFEMDTSFLCYAYYDDMG